jgi:hypothetical protein
MRGKKVVNAQVAPGACQSSEGKPGINIVVFLARREESSLERALATAANPDTWSARKSARSAVL